MRALAWVLGSSTYYIAHHMRKTALSNITCAYPSLNEKHVRRMARRSFCHLALTLLEYGLLARKRGDVSSFATCLNPSQATELKEKYGGIIYVSSHMANWEVPFIETNTRARGIAVGRPLKSSKLTDWINSIRSSTGGSIVSPREAMRTAKKELSSGTFFGFVGDQGLPESSYSGPFIHRRAFSTTAPALLAYKHSVPIVIAQTRRKGNKQIIWYTPPIFPDKTQPLKEEVIRLTDKVMYEIEHGILQAPEQWMWLHHRWKRPTKLNVLKEYRYETLLIIYPDDPEELAQLTEKSDFFRYLYPHHDISVLIPSHTPHSPVEGAKLYLYSSFSEMKIDSLAFKLVYDFTDHVQLRRYYRARACLHYLSIGELAKANQIERRACLHDWHRYLCTHIYEETWEPTDFLRQFESNRTQASSSQDLSTTT
jgi:KDO2-lipid IV(A) lauroyltransferase